MSLEKAPMKGCGNTLNVCVGHLPFPAEFSHYIDLMIAPCEIAGPRYVEVVSYDTFGDHGDTLGEYGQLFWLHDHFDEVAGGYEFVRIFHYRRFASQNQHAGVPSVNVPWSKTIRPAELRDLASDFDRNCTGELFNQPVTFDGGIMTQYARWHVLEDLLNFGKYLIESHILDQSSTAALLSSQTMIPAATVGVFRTERLRSLLALTRGAAGFMRSPYFVVREGYQRRGVGFLLERLQSVAILHSVRSGDSRSTFGHHLIISETERVSSTI